MTESNGSERTMKVEDFMTSKTLGNEPRPPAPQQQAQLMMGHPTRTFAYRPLDDVTAYEVAHILQFVVVAMTSGAVEEAYARLPEPCKRHFEIME